MSSLQNRKTQFITVQNKREQFVREWYRRVESITVQDRKRLFVTVQHSLLKYRTEENSFYITVHRSNRYRGWSIGGWPWRRNICVCLVTSVNPAVLQHCTLLWMLRKSEIPALWHIFVTFLILWPSNNWEYCCQIELSISRIGLFSFCLTVTRWKSRVDYNPE